MPLLCGSHGDKTACQFFFVCLENVAGYRESCNKSGAPMCLNYRQAPLKSRTIFSVGSVEVNRFCITASSPMSQPLSSSWFILCPSSYATPFLTMRSVSLFVCDFFPHFFSSIFPLPSLSLSPFFLFLSLSRFPRTMMT